MHKAAVQRDREMPNAEGQREAYARRPTRAAGDPVARVKGLNERP